MAFHFSLQDQTGVHKRPDDERDDEEESKLVTEPMNVERTLGGRLGKRKPRHDDYDDYEDDLFLSEEDFDANDDMDDLSYEDGEQDDVMINVYNDVDMDIDPGLEDVFDDEDALDIDPDAIYNERMEVLPKFAAYDSEVPKIGNGLTSKTQDILTILDANPCSSPVVKSFQSKAKELMEIPNPQPIWIALLGDTGAGMQTCQASSQL